MTQRLSFNQALKVALKNGTWPPDATGEESQQLARHLQVVAQESSVNSFVQGRSFVIPTSALLSRDLSVSVATAGGNLVGTSKPSLIDLLRPFSAIASYGPTVLTGLTSNVSLPAVATGAVAGWSAENAPLTTGDPTFSLPVILTPKLVSTTVKMSRTLMVSSGFDFEAALLREMYAAIGGELDRVALLGTGAGNQPLGILNAPGTSAITFGGAATWPNILKFETAVGKKNAPKDKLAWLGSNNTAEKLKQTVKSAGSSNFIWQDGKIDEYRAEATSWLDTGDQLVFGSWDALVIGQWLDGIQVTIDPYSSAASNEIKFIVTLYVDIGLLRPGLFSVSVDSAAQ